VKERHVSRELRAVEGIRVSGTAFAGSSSATCDAETVPTRGREQGTGGLRSSDASISVEMAVSYTSKRVLLLRAW